MTPAFASSGTILPTWIVLPVTGLAMAIITIHWLSLRSSTDPNDTATPDQATSIDEHASSKARLSARALRRRLRLANAALLYLITPLLAYGTGIASPAQPKPFMYVWTLIAGLSGLVLFIALADAWLVWAEHRARVTSLHRELLQRRLSELSLESPHEPAPTNPSPSTPAPPPPGARI
jgi:hypothetical protein